MSSAAIVQRRTRLAGALLIAGAIVFWSGFFMPSSVVYLTPGFLKKIELIASHRTSWMLQHMIFLAGVTVTTIGLTILARILLQTRARQLAITGLVAILAATAVWALAVYVRLSVPAEQITHPSDVPPLFLSALYGWIFAAFIVLTLGAFIIYGVALSQAGLLTQLGTAAAVLSTLMLLVAIIVTVVWAVTTDFGVSPPLGGSVPEVQYIVTLLIGIGLLRHKPPGTLSSSSARAPTSSGPFEDLH